MTTNIRCPECGRRSYNPHDISQGFCGNCHDWTMGVVSDRSTEDEDKEREYFSAPKRSIRRERAIMLYLVGGFAFILLLIILTGCSTIQSGTIEKKVVHPAYTWVQYICGGYNSKGICTVQVPIFHSEPETYSFDIREGEETGFVYVGYSVFVEYEVGDYYREPVSQ